MHLFKPLFICLLFTVLTCSVDTGVAQSVVTSGEQRQVAFGVLARQGGAKCRSDWTATIDHLNRAINGKSFILDCISFDEVDEVTAEGKIDFLVANPATYTLLEVMHGISRIATLVNNYNGSYQAMYGGVIFVRSDRGEIDIGDIGGLRIAAVDPRSFGGWLAQLHALKEDGDVEPTDLKNVEFTGSHDEVVYRVLNGEADVGFARSDTLEKLQAKGEMVLDEVYIFHLHDENVQEKFPFVLSTPLYPEWPLAKMVHTDDKLTREVVAALLNMASVEVYGETRPVWQWTFPMDYQSVRQCLKSLEVPPYEVKEPSLKAVLMRYLKLSVAGMFLVLAGAGLLVYFLALNRRLQQALELRDKELGEKQQAEAEKTKLIEELSQGERKFRSFFDSVNDAVLVFPHNGGKDNRFIEVNRVACDRYGYTREEFCQLSVADISVAEEQSKSGWSPAGILNSGASIFETLHRSRDGKLIPVEISSSVVELQGKPVNIAVVRDRRERLKVENEKRRLATAVEQAAEMVVITDVLGRIQYVNPAFCEVTGYGAEETLGRGPRFFYRRLGGMGPLKEMRDHLEAGRVWKGRIKYRRKDGAELLVHIAVSPIRNPFDEVTNYVAVMRDMTREASLEMQLGQAMKMEAIGTLAGGIAHDFNNILSVILGCGQLAQRKLDQGLEVGDELRQIVSSGQRAADLVKQILTFSRREAEELKPLQVQFVVKEALKLMRSTLPSTVELKEQIDMDCGPVLADATKIHQVLMNLCTNAKDAMGQEGGVLAVSLNMHRQGQPENGEKTRLKQGSYAVLEVRDTGCGMTREMSEKIFEPFYTTKEVGAGTGLGLSVVHGIVESHGGQITVISEPGKGSAFHIYLPVVRDYLDIREERREEGAVAGSERLLLVDDEPGISRMMQISLGMYGYEVSTCLDGEEALGIFEKDPEQFDLVITDMTMPKMTGLKLAREMVAIRPDIPILLCTGYSEYVEGEDLEKSGVREFLLKPVDVIQLARTIRRVLASDD